MNRLLFERSTGNIGPNVFARLQSTKLLHSFEPTPQIRFNGGENGTAVKIDENGAIDPNTPSSIWAHQAGVNALALDRFDGKVLISGGIDGSIRLWDLEQCSDPTKGHTYTPAVDIPRSPETHKFGITHLSFFPFDPHSFLSTSYDKTLKAWSTRCGTLAASFDLGHRIYTHATSPIAHHLLVACGTQHPATRLVDLRTGSFVQSLPGQRGAVLATSWSPRDEHILATGGVDGTVKLWDIRRAGGVVGMLNKDDGLGVFHNGNMDPSGRVRLQTSAKAHTAPANGLTWTDDGAYLVSAGHDAKIRVWDIATGRNTLASFGPTIKNSQLGSAIMFTSPVGLTHPGEELLFWPNEKEILVLDLHDGHVVTKLRETGPSVTGIRTSTGATQEIPNRITSIVWRGAGGGDKSSGAVMGGSNTAGAVFGAHLDGQIRAWTPRLEGDDNEDDDDSLDASNEERTKKRRALNDVFQGLMEKKINFS